MKIFIDTNVFVRFLVNDDPKQFQHVKKLFEAIEAGSIKPYTSNIVVLELVYVLTRIYKVKRSKALDDINTLLQLRNLTVVEKSNTKKALKWANEVNIKYADLLIATQVPAEVTLCTYDKEFNKIPNFKVVNPSKIKA